jgi:hypothetical protein
MTPSPKKAKSSTSKKRREDPQKREDLQKREEENKKRQAIHANKKAQHFLTFIPQCILWATPPVPKQTKTKDVEDKYSWSWVQLQHREGSNDLAAQFLDCLKEFFINQNGLNCNKVFFTQTNINACFELDSTFLLSTPTSMVIGVALLLRFLALYEQHKNNYQVDQPTISFTHASLMVDKFKEDAAALCWEIGDNYTLVIVPPCDFLVKAGVQHSSFYAQMADLCQMPFGTKFFPPLNLVHHMYYKPFLDHILRSFKLPAIPEVNLATISAQCHDWKDVPPYLLEIINHETFQEANPEWTEDYMKSATNQGFVFKPHYGTLSMDIFLLHKTWDPPGKEWKAYYPATGRVSHNLQAEIAQWITHPWNGSDVGASTMLNLMTSTSNMMRSVFLPSALISQPPITVLSIMLFRPTPSKGNLESVGQYMNGQWTDQSH